LTTRTTKTKTSGRTGSGRGGGTRRTSKTLTLEQEAEEFLANKNKNLNARIYLTGCALSGLLSRYPGGNEKEVIKQAIAWADKVLEELE